MEKNEHNINEILREKAGEERTETIWENESVTVFENDKVSETRPYITIRCFFARNGL